MEENIYNGHGCDKIEQRIVDRLGNRQNKIEKMSSWEQAAGNRVRRLYTVLSVAACLAVAFISTNLLQGGSAIEELGIAAPRMEQFRAAVPELAKVEQLINDGEYYKALDIAGAALEKSNKEVMALEKNSFPGDEEWEYEYAGERLLNSELRWAYIYLLVMVERDDTAVEQLKIYLQDTAYCNHREEAEALLNVLT